MLEIIVLLANGVLVSLLLEVLERVVRDEPVPVAVAVAEALDDELEDAVAEEEDVAEAKSDEELVAVFFKLFVAAPLDVTVLLIMGVRVPVDVVVAEIDPFAARVVVAVLVVIALPFAVAERVRSEEGVRDAERERIVEGDAD